MVLTPTYHVFSMYKPFQDAKVLPIESNVPDYLFMSWKVPAVSVSAARSASGSTLLALVNLQPQEPIDVRATVAGLVLKNADARILSAASTDAHNTFADPHVLEPRTFKEFRLSGQVLSASLPAKSVVVIELR
jgi:alpha-N-arabinofuranosidase